MRLLSLLLALAFVPPASTQTPPPLTLYIGPVPNPDGVVAPVSKDFTNSYNDLKKAHAKLKTPDITLVDDPAQADAILSVTRRGDVEAGTTVGGSLPPISLGGGGISSTQRVLPTLLAALYLFGFSLNQLSIAGNACGPAALLTAFRFGNENWQRAGSSIAGENDRQRLSYVIRNVAMRPSRHLGGRPRWSKSGVNVADLCDIANELTAGQYLPQVRYEVLFLKPKESQEKLLRRVHDRLSESLAKGLPPVIST